MPVPATRPPPPKIPIALPKLTTDGRVCFYGYDVSMEWLIDYATRNWLWDPNNKNYDDLSKISGALVVLSFQSGVKHLELESAFKDQSAPSNTVTMPGYRHGEIRVPVLSVTSVHLSGDGQAKCR